MSASGDWNGWEFTPKKYLLCPSCVKTYKKKVRYIMEAEDADRFLAQMVPVDPNEHARFDEHKCSSPKCNQILSILFEA